MHRRLFPRLLPLLPVDSVVAQNAPAAIAQRNCLATDYATHFRSKDALTLEWHLGGPDGAEVKLR